MRNLKKILAMALTVLMVVGSFAMTATAAFDDVTDYQEAIEVMAALGIAAGKSETEFAPDDDVTREEMALWIAKIMTGKVAADYVTNNFLGAVENLTAFADLDEDNYVGAINYATNNGIIVGTSATTFEPAEAIKIQDVFAMVVRMLGYGSTAMNNNYPWSFIDKAISLGLDADLPADYSNEAVASRGETMQILFNALTALKSDGSTLGYDFFGLEKATVVITGTSKGNMYTGAELVTKTVDDEDYVSFSILNANGTVASDKATYYVLKSAFGIDVDANAQWYVGNSYVVRTVDGFASFLTCEATDSVVVDENVVVGAASNSSSITPFVTVDGTKYRLAKANSEFVNDGIEEIVVLLPNGNRTEVYDAASYVMDADLNILGEDGKILLHWVTTIGMGNAPEYANLNGMYLYQLADGNYIQPNDYIWSLAKKVSINVSNAYGFEAADNSYSDIEQYDAYSTTKLYDDDADGDYDRAIYFQYRFGKAGYTDCTINGTNYPYLTMNGAKVDPRATTTLNPHYNTGINYYNADGEKISYADIAGKYVLYTYNTLYKTLIVKEIFEGNTGLVTGVDLVNKKLTLNAFGANFISGVVTGETYTIGNDKLFGATFNTIKALDTANNALTNVLGKNINFIEKDGKILAIYNAVDNANYMVYVNEAPGFTTMGYNNILAYYDPAANRAAATQAVITVNAVNNYWYSSYVNGKVDSIDAFTTGAFVEATKDALGNYDIAISVDGLVDDVTTITVNNGIVSGDGEFVPFKAQADTVFIIWDGNRQAFNFKTFTGIPADGATITATGNVYVIKDDLVYVQGGSANNVTTSYNPWGGFDQNSTIIYADVDTIATMQATNAYQYGVGINVGMTYSYKNAIDVINGGFAANVMTDYNFNARLEAGNFYRVVNGYVVEKITNLAAAGIQTGILLSADSKGTIAADAGAKYNYKLATAYTYDDDADLYIYTESKTSTTATLPKLYKKSAANDYWKTTTLYEILSYADANGATDARTAAAWLAKINEKVEDGIDDGILVYYYAGENNNFGSAPAFFAIAAGDGIVSAKAYAATEGTAKSGDIEKKIQFRFYNVNQNNVNEKYAFFTVDANGIDEKIATTFQSADVNWAKTTKTITADLGDTMVKTSDGVPTGEAAASVYVGKQYAVVIENSVLKNYDVKISYIKNSTTDANVIDSSVEFDWDKVNVNNSNNSTIFYFTVNADMEYTATETVNDIFVNVLFVAK